MPILGSKLVGLLSIRKTTVSRDGCAAWRQLEQNKANMPNDAARNPLLNIGHLA